MPAHLPTYLSGFDQSSRWHTSATQLAAIESVAIPSRLRQTESGRATLDDFEAILGDNGKRRIAQLEYSVEDPAILDGSSNGNGYHDSRMNGRGHDDQEDNANVAHLDIDTTPTVPNLDGRRMPPRRNHIFSQVQSLRGKWKASIEIEDINQAARDRKSQGPRIQTHQTTLLLPVLDSFPNIFDFGYKPKTLAVQASLSASSSVAHRVGSIEQIARQLVSVDERESLCDGLINICEEYEDGWNSGSDVDDDL